MPVAPEGFPGLNAKEDIDWHTPVIVNQGERVPINSAEVRDSSLIDARLARKALTIVQNLNEAQ